MQKVDARKLGQQNRKQLSLIERTNKSHVIFEKIKNELKDCKLVGCYVSMKEEVDTKEILQYCFEHSIPVSVPKTVGNTLEFFIIHSFDDLQEGSFHVLEPRTDLRVALADINLMIVPVSAYDSHHNRCGYGKGFYDSILKKCERKIGIAFSTQEVDFIEKDPWDIPLDQVITEKDGNL